MPHHSALILIAVAWLGWHTRATWRTPGTRWANLSVVGDPLVGSTDVRPSRPRELPFVPPPRPARPPRLNGGDQPRRPPRSADRFRSDIEGLRAVAVLLVLAYHAEIGPFSGGFVGVDVFFVVSGFLITSLLLRERELTGTVALPSFWARRARRLLPASCLTVVATLVAARFMLEPLRLENLGRDALAASLFVVNFVFGHRAADYLTSTEAPSPLLHFWSLAVEEQFYLVWPPVIFLIARRARLPRRAIGWAVVVIGAASFLSGLWYTANQPARAYYYPWNRVWELLAGAGLAVAGPAVLRLPERVRAGAGWVGLAAIVVAGVAFGAGTPFPGTAALVPVGATVAVLMTGGTAASGGPVVLLRAGVLQWIGRRSYAIYLWHWPVLVLADAAWGPLPAAARVAAIVLAVAISAVSYVAVEDSVRRSSWMAAVRVRSLALGAGLVTVGVLAAVVSLALRPDLSTGAVASTPTLPAAPALAPIADLADLEAAAGPALAEAARVDAVPDNLRPGFGDVGGDLPSIYDDGCLLPDSGAVTSGECVYGHPDSETTVVLAGDSHAAQWFPALHDAAERRGWRLVVQAKRGCPAADFPTYGEGNRERTECGPWREEVAARLAAERPDVLVVTSYRYRLTSLDAPAGSGDLWRAAVGGTLAAWRPLAAEVLVLSDTPNPVDDIPTCLSAHLQDATECTRARGEADKADLLGAERAAADANDAGFVATSGWLCGDTTCPAILGDLLLYRDDNHITATASRHLTPFVEAAIAPLLTG